MPSFGDPAAELLILGLAPAAHGGNRTGRMFTGDRSGDFLYLALHRAGFATQAESLRVGDGLQLENCYITAVGRCAPPANKPLPEELSHCRPYLEQELRLLENVRVVVALGRIAFDSYLKLLVDKGSIPSRRPYTFGHGASYELSAPLPQLFVSYHPSQQNTLTGKLTDEMFQSLFRQIKTFLAKNRT